MVRSSRWAPVALAATVLMVALAGCAGNPPPAAAGPDPFAGLGEDVQVAKGKGAIAGIVVDPAIRPLANAAVELIGASNTTTDEQGRFAFEGLEPGTYFLRATLHRFEAVQVSAAVAAGEAAKVRILMLPLTGAEPYHLTLQLRGHIENYLGFANFAVEVLAPGTLACACTLDVPVDANLTTVLVEATGQVLVENPGTPATVPGDAYWEVMAGTTADGELRDSAYDEFPLSKRFDASVFEGADVVGVRITCGVWPCVTMDYDLFVTVWYHEAAPEGWSIFTADA